MIGADDAIGHHGWPLRDRSSGRSVCLISLRRPNSHQRDFRRVVQSWTRKEPRMFPISPELVDRRRRYSVLMKLENVMTEKTLNDLFYDTLKDIYFAERQILKTLPKLAKAAKSEELKSAFLTHRDETEGHVARLGAGL